MSCFLGSPTQALSDKFRLNYARLWQSILAADIKGIKQYSDVLGAGEMYGLFACMLTARSWESVSKGIDKIDLSQSEVWHLIYFGFIAIKSLRTCHLCW